MSLGLRDAGFTVLVGADSDPFAVETHAANLGGLGSAGGLTDPDEFLELLGQCGIGGVDLVAGGPIRDQQEPSLFHLPARQTKYGFTDEMAVDLNGLLRIGCEALLPRSVGMLDDNEMRVLGERLVAHLEIDLEPVTTREVQERLQQLTGPEML